MSEKMSRVMVESVPCKKAGQLQKTKNLELTWISDWKEKGGKKGVKNGMGDRNVKGEERDKK